METTVLSRIFEPIRIGGMQVRNRIMAPPHAALLGNLLGTEAEADRYIDYWRSLAEGGTGWLIALNGFLENQLPPGFDPTGVGARRQGVFRDPRFVDRMGRLAAEVHAAGARAGTQIIMQGGMPHGPSATLSGPVINNVPHALTRREIGAFVKEYAFSAVQAARAGLDSIELHANHDDLIEWFLSPLTNERGDDYGGGFAGRARFLGEILDEIRQAVGESLVVGVRLNMEEAEPGGYGKAGGLEIAQWIEATAKVDYLHLVMGTGWGFPSYIQTHHFAPGAWSDMAGDFRSALSLPIVYAGRVNSPETAEAILAAGYADMVGVGRAHLADPAFVNKAASGKTWSIAPCLACNDCISRPLAEGLPFACTVNPALAANDRAPLPRTDAPRRVLVVGGGPAGMELAVTAAGRGHDVTLHEAGGALGGKILLAARMPTQQGFLDYVRYQERRLADAGVTVCLNTRATPGTIRAFAPDVAALAVGARPRRPRIEGSDGANVHDMEAVARDDAALGKAVAVVVQDDHVAPLAMADSLARRGHAVTMFVQTNSPAPVVSRYALGTWLGRLSEAGVAIVCMEAVTRIVLPDIHTRHVYSQRASVHGGFDSVVLACGGVPDTALQDALEGESFDVHVLGDAYAPRRIVFATQQGYQLGKLL